jgi:predicted RNase H-like HicB family nuclease
MGMKNNKKDIAYYQSLPWTYTVEQDKDLKGKPIYIVSVNELPGIKTDATTIKKAMELIKEAMEAAFELYQEMGKEIPEPVAKDEFKGHIAYRTTNSRHYLLAREARKRNKSLSKLLDECIDIALGKNK